MNTASDPKDERMDGEELEFESVVEVSEDGDEYAGDTLKKLRESLRACQKERQEFLDGWQRAKADFLNQRVRYEEEQARKVMRAENELIERILQLADSFDMAFKNQDAWNAVDPVWAKGVKGIHAQLVSVLRDYGVTEIAAEGASFDPSRHDAYAQKPVDDAAAHETVIEVAQKGYIRGDTVLRPARVVIGVYENKGGKEE